MRRIPLPVLLFLALGACQTTTGGVAVDRNPEDLLIAVEETNADGRTDRRVVDEFAATMSARGLRVFDAAALDGRADDPLAAARATVSPPVGTVALVTIHVDRRDLAHTRRLRIRVGGRLVDVASGQRLGNAEAAASGDIHPDCLGPCMIDAAGDIARGPAREVTDMLAAQLVGAGPASPDPVRQARPARGVLMVFDDFEPAEMRAIDRRIGALPGRRAHRPVASYARHAEIWYESALPRDRLRDEMTRLFGDLGMRVRISADDNDWRFRRIRLPLAAARRAPDYNW